MAADLNQLVPALKSSVDTLLAGCQARRIVMRPFFTLRSPFEQAKLWRQSRSLEEISEKIADFRNNGAPFLAFCIGSVGPQSGDPVTNAAPGFSWHQWGEAVDCFWLVDNQAMWSTKKMLNGQNGYQVYAEEAKRLGLTPGGFWNSLKDWPHVQLQSAADPGKSKTLAEIDAAMKARFGS